MRILLVCKSKIMENLGVMYLAAVARHAGHETKICSHDEAVTLSKYWNPGIIGYSVMTGDQRRFIDLSRGIKNCWPAGKKDPTHIFGGPHPSFWPYDFQDHADVVVTGEAENDFAELIESPHRYPDIESIPWPDRTDFPGMKIRDFIASRGCPYNCGYCYNSWWASMHPDLPRVRTRPVGDVIKEILYVSPEFVYFQDSCFGVSRSWMRQFSGAYKAQVNIPYHCHMRPVQIDDEKAHYLADSNCVSLRIALETADPRLRELIGRGKTTNEDTIRASKVLKKYQIGLMIQNILGLPTSTIENDLHTLEVNIRCRPEYGWCSIYQPYPGTALGDFCRAGEIYKGDYSEISDSFFDRSVLDFSEEHKEKLVCLQRMFALCVEGEYVPMESELTYENFPKLVHKVMRKIGDNRLYGGVI